MNDKKYKVKIILQVLTKTDEIKYQLPRPLIKELITRLNKGELDNNIKFLPEKLINKYYFLVLFSHFGEIEKLINHSIEKDGKIHCLLCMVARSQLNKV